MVVNKERMSHLCDSTVAGPNAQRDNAQASRCEYPPFSYPPLNVPELLSYCNYYGTEKINQLFQHKTFWPNNQNLPFWTPPSKSLCNSFLGKACQGVMGGFNKGVPNGAFFVHKKILFMLSFRASFTFSHGKSSGT